MLKDFGLITIMEGHKALVSALLIDKEVLYSGSWDGTIRLWWRRDHCPLTVLNETTKLGAVLALASSDELLLVGYQSGRLQVSQHSWMFKLLVILERFASMIIHVGVS